MAESNLIDRWQREAGLSLPSLSYYVQLAGTIYKVVNLCLQCFDAVGWVAGRASSL